MPRLPAQPRVAEVEWRNAEVECRVAEVNTLL